MFEYLMPLLVMPSYENTLLDETMRGAVERQIEYGKQRGVPWGMSESGYNLTDAQLNYQYRAFGVPGLGLKRGLADDLVVAPYGALGPAVIEGDDQAFQNTLLALGIEGWPVTDAPRLSRLWVPNASGEWLFAGLMVESPEPIHRPGRVDLDSLTLDMGLAGSIIRFDIRRRDRSGSRLIYLTSTPFAVVTRERIPNVHWPFMERLKDRSWPQFRTITPQLVLRAKARLDNVSTDVSGSLVIPPTPSFSEDP